MITGFNTDIEHDGVVYHVQTEDKGLDTPIILSLVYVGGTILASKRAPYEDLIAEGFSDEVLAERLKRQHRLICAAINSGRINDLKKMSRRPAGRPAEIPKELPKVASEVVSEFLIEPEVEPIEPEIEREREEEEQPEPIHQEEEQPEIEREEEEQEEAPVTAYPEFDLELEEIPSQIWSPPPPKVEPPPPSPEAPVIPQSATEAGYDSGGQIHLRDTPEEGLAILLLNDADFNSGEYRTLRVLVVDRKGTEEKALNGVAVSIKILGTTFRPLIYSLKTDRDGVASVTTQIPEFSSGRAAVLVRAVAKDQAAELRRVIHPGA